jgi:cytochrome b561
MDLPSLLDTGAVVKAEQSSTEAPRYDALTIVLHWLLALMVAALWIGAETLDWFADAASRADARSAHIALGFALAALGGGRFVWRLSFGRLLPPADTGVLGTLAQVMHFGLYALLAAMVFVGMLLVWASGDSVFNHVALTAGDAASLAQAAKLRSVHAAIGWAILVAVALHVAAVLFHQYVRRDAVLSRMLPRWPF